MNRYGGPLSQYAKYKSRRRAKVGGRASQQPKERSVTPTCRVSGCPSPVTGDKGIEGELCPVHLRAARERLAEERKRRRRM